MKDRTMYCGKGDVFVTWGCCTPGTGWTVDPFGGVIKENRLFGRGAAVLQALYQYRNELSEKKSAIEE